MRFNDFNISNPVEELEKRLVRIGRGPLDVNVIKQLVNRIAARHNISKDTLRGDFIHKHGNSPDDWVKKIKQRNEEVNEANPNQQVSLYNPNGKTYRQEKMPTLDNPEDIFTRGKEVPFKATKRLQSEKPSADESLKRFIAKFMDNLNPAERQVMYKRFWEDKTLAEIAQDMGVSAARIRQIEAAVFRKFKSPSNTNRNDIQQYIKLSEDNDSVIPEINKFIKWTKQKLNIKGNPNFTFSKDTDQAQQGHHTGRHSGNDIWVYIGNRNLIDILRTVFHELVHQRQAELNMIKDGDSYPGSPIEAMADMLAGKYIKIYGKENPHIFQ